MQTHFRDYIAAILAPVQHATLATSGPAGLLAHVLPCAANGLHLYLLLPQTSDHLLNLAASPDLVVTTQGWQVRGRGRVISAAERAALPSFADHAGAQWSVIVEVTPTRVDIAQQEGWGAAETFDVNGDRQ